MMFDIETWREQRQRGKYGLPTPDLFNSNNPLVREGLCYNQRLNDFYITKLLKDKSARVRENIMSKYKFLAKEALHDKDWKVRYSAVNNNFNIPKDVLMEYTKDSDDRVSNKAKEVLDILHDYIYREKFDNTITIKLVIPNVCNANCCFCYGKGYKTNQGNLRQQFLENFLYSLEEIILKIDKRQPISLDITGGEPTEDYEFLIKVLRKIRSFYLKNRINRITMTTNGYHLKEVIPELKDTIDYVNISIHDFKKEEREKIFNTNTFNDKDYKKMVLDLLDIGIQTSAISVIYKSINNFEQFRDDFIKWAENIGFVSIRFRKNVFWQKDIFKQYMNKTIQDNDFGLIQEEHTPDSNWCMLYKDDGFLIYFLEGVPDVSKVSLGIEFVIHNDGMPYADFNKQIPLKEYKLPLGYIFDKK